MNTASIAESRTRLPRHTRMALALFAVCGLYAGVASAQVVTSDPTGLAKLAEEYKKQLQQYQQQVQQYQLQLQQYQQMLISIQNLTSGGGMLTINNTPEHLDANQLAQLECGDSGGGASLIGGVVGSLTSSFNAPYVQAQKHICQNIVTIEVDKYNRTSDMMVRMNYYSAVAKQTESSRDSVGSSNNGDMSSNTNQATRNLANLNTEVANWQSQMNSDDEMLKTLQDTQSVLARAALDGKSDLLGASVQAAALEAALKINQ